jgi:hypothetical protein
MLSQADPRCDMLYSYGKEVGITIIRQHLGQDLTANVKIVNKLHLSLRMYSPKI